MLFSIALWAFVKDQIKSTGIGSYPPTKTGGNSTNVYCLRYVRSLPYLLAPFYFLEIEEYFGIFLNLGLITRLLH